MPSTTVRPISASPITRARTSSSTSRRDYGYSLRPRWWRGWGPRYRDMYEPMVTQYTQGTVIVDVFDPKNKELLWRGQGVAAVSDNQEQYVQDLQTTVGAILAKFPAATGKVAQAQ